MRFLGTSTYSTCSANRHYQSERVIAKPLLRLPYACLCLPVAGTACSCALLLVQRRHVHSHESRTNHMSEL